VLDEGFGAPSRSPSARCYQSHVLTVSHSKKAKALYPIRRHLHSFFQYIPLVLSSQHIYLRNPSSPATYLGSYPRCRTGRSPQGAAQLSFDVPVLHEMPVRPVLVAAACVPGCVRARRLVHMPRGRSQRTDIERGALLLVLRFATCTAAEGSQRMVGVIMGVLTPRKRFFSNRRRTRSKRSRSPHSSRVSRTVRLWHACRPQVCHPDRCEHSQGRMRSN